MTALTVKCIAALAFGFVVALPSVAAANTARVLLVRPSGAAAEVNAALVRAQGELVADGFEVVSIEAAPGTTSAMAMDAQNLGTRTTVGLFLSADGQSAELWVVDRSTNKTVVRQVSTAGGDQNLLPEVLALRAVELLRASLLELAIEGNTTSALPPESHPAVRHATGGAAPPPLPLQRWAIETGTEALWSPGQVDASVESLARARLAITEYLQLRLSIAGLGTRPKARGTGGVAELEQWEGLAEAVFVPFPKPVLRPVCSLGVGTFHTAVKGEASWPYQGVQASQWAFAADAGVGLGLRVASRLELAAEAHALWATPEPIVRFVSADGPHVARPGAAFSLTLVGWL